MDAEEYNKLKEDRQEKIDQANTEMGNGKKRIGWQLLKLASRIGENLLRRFQ